MTQSKRDKNTIQREVHQLLVQLLAMIDHCPALEIQQTGLEAMVHLTGSSLGYIYAIDCKAGTVQMENVVGADQTWKSVAHAQLESLTETGPWSACLASDKPQVYELTNLATPLFGTINRGLSVPIRRRDELVAVIGVGNSQTPYQVLDGEVLQELATTLGRIVVRKRLHDSMPDDLK